MDDKQYIEAIDAEAVRVGYCEPGESLVAMTGPEPWLEAWREDPTLTPAEQVEAEIQAARESM